MGVLATAGRAWKGVLRVARPHTPFQGEYPLGEELLVQGAAVFYSQVCVLLPPPDNAVPWPIIALQKERVTKRSWFQINWGRKKKAVGLIQKCDIFM